MGQDCMCTIGVGIILKKEDLHSGKDIISMPEYEDKVTIVDLECLGDNVYIFTKGSVTKLDWEYSLKNLIIPIVNPQYIDSEKVKLIKFLNDTNVQFDEENIKYFGIPYYW